MIVVLGRPGSDPRAETPGDVAGLAARVAVAAAAAGRRVELAGAVGDDDQGDDLLVRLGRAGVGHAAVLRDPAGRTPALGADPGPMPRLDAEDVRLALSYLPECDVLVLAEDVTPAVQEVVVDAAAYHGAHLVIIAAAGASLDRLPATALVLETPDADEGPFAAFVARYVVAADRDGPSATALADAARDAGWERAPAG